MPRLPLLLFCALLGGAALAQQQQQQQQQQQRPDVCGFASTGVAPQLCGNKPSCNGTCRNRTCE
jgi:hypothetical protein